MSSAIGYEGGVPLTGKIARDRWVKKLRDEDLDRRDANLGRAGAAGAIAGALFPSRKAGLYARMGAGALAGSLGVLGVRQATKNTRDAYGERSRGAKRAEMIPAAAGLTAAGVLTAKKLGILKKLKMQSAECRVVALEKPFHGYNAKRHAKTGGLNDSFRKKYNREHGSNLKRPVTTEPSKLKPGSKAAKRRKSFCSRMGGMPGSTSKGGELTPKGAALKRWNCEAEVSSVQFSVGSKKEKKGLNPYLGATASGAISGAGLGFIPTILRRGSTLKGALKAGALGGLASGAIVGGGALIGSKILGAPREDEGSAFTKRAAIGGTLAGAGAGLAGGILLRKTRGGARMLVGASKNWRPAQWLRKSPLAGSAAIGAVGGAIYGGATGADEGQQVDGFRSLKKDLRKDVKAAAMRLEGRVGSVQLFAQKDWRDARRESRSEAIKDVMAGGGALAAGVGVGGGALWAARKFGQNADKAGAAADQVTATLKGVTKPRFVRSRQWMKKQMTTFPTFTKVMKKFRLENTEFAMKPVNPELISALKRSAGEGLMRIGKPTKDMKALLAAERARTPSWNRGVLNKLRNALALERKAKVHSFQLSVNGQYKPELTEEQRKVRNAVAAGAVGVGAAGGVAALGLRSLRQAEEAMRNRVSPVPMAAPALPAPTTKKNLTPTVQDKWAAAKARAAMSSKGSGRPIRVDAPQAMARQAEAQRIKDVRSVSRAPIADAVPGARAATKARVAQGRKLQKIASVENAGVLSRGERLAAAGALAALRKKFRFEHNFAVVLRDEGGRSAGWKNYLRGDKLVDSKGNPAVMSLPTFVRSAHRDAEKGWRTIRRGSGFAQDLQEVARGQKTKKREWEKGYFKNAVASGLLTGAALVGGVAYRKGGMYGAPKWAQAWHKGLNYAGGKIGKAQGAAQGWLNRQVGLESRLNATIRMFGAPEYEDFSRQSRKLNNAGGYFYSGAAGILPGAVAGALLAGKRGIKPGIVAGALGGLSTRHSARNMIKAKETQWQKEAQNGAGVGRQWWNDQKHAAMNVAIPVGLLAGGVGLAKATPKIWKGAAKAGRATRKAATRVAARMPVSKATQDARFAKAKPARAWVVGGTQSAPNDWPRLMESRMNATLQMFEDGYAPFGYQNYYSAPGWDLRDARGRSARVFAPGAKKRVRRQAEWHEKKDNQKKLIAGAGIAAALLAGGGGLLAGRKIERAAKAAQAAVKAPENIIKVKPSMWN